ncbi:unnamed protein product [Ceratitis capitata]|uniref:(Mediterranean fruit fly) hypothetical protein n=1 Tax=Ceratitis capitata TaxID=7213 RepID=A0A811V5D9_CERCA|nr:unnamed protein product [Ceratitis capitata]
MYVLICRKIESRVHPLTLKMSKKVTSIVASANPKRENKEESQQSYKPKICIFLNANSPLMIHTYKYLYIGVLKLKAVVYHLYHEYHGVTALNLEHQKFVELFQREGEMVYKT